LPSDSDGARLDVIAQVVNGWLVHEQRTGIAQHLEDIRIGAQPDTILSAQPVADYLIVKELLCWGVSQTEGGSLCCLRGNDDPLIGSLVTLHLIVDGWVATGVRKRADA
jgi:hypothetical protein